jgi:hypothetical protein
VSADRARVSDPPSRCLYSVAVLEVVVPELWCLGFAFEVVGVAGC